MEFTELKIGPGYWELGLDALDFRNYVAVNRTLIKKYGLNVAVLIGELASEARYYRDKGQLDDGWFFSTVENIEEHTGLNAYYQREAIEKMKELGIVEVQYKGLPRKRYFRVNAYRVVEEMAVDAQCFTECTTGNEPSERLEVHPVDVNNNKEQPISTTVTKKKDRCFAPPTLDEVRKYCRERGNHVDPESFIDYYSSQGWKKANGQRVSDWRGCVRTWEKKDERGKRHDSQARGTGRNDDLESLGYLKFRTDVTL